MAKDQDVTSALLAMYLLGNIYEANEVWDFAMKWYVLAFQTAWLEKYDQCTQSLGYQAIKRLVNDCQHPYRLTLYRVLEMHPLDMYDIRERYMRYNILGNLYQEAKFEEYLGKEESQWKAKRLDQELGIISASQSKETMDGLLNAPAKFKEVCNIRDPKKIAEFSMNNLFLPFALHALGNLYGDGYFDVGKPNYEKAAEYYKKARTIEAFAALASLCSDGLAETINGKINYERAEYYALLAGNDPMALYQLGSNYMQTNNFRKAKKCFEQSDTPQSHFSLGKIYQYYQKFIDQQEGINPYKQAQYHFEIAIKNGVEEAYTNLGLLYYHGHIVKKGRSNYELAVECYEKAAVADSQAYYYLGIMYLRGEWGCKPNGEQDYETAYQYLKRNNTVVAKLAILSLYQSDVIQPGPSKSKEQITEELYQEIDKLLDHLLATSGSNPFVKSQMDYLYYKGLLDYYMGKWKQALIYLQSAWAMGSQKAGIDLIIEDISKELFEEETHQDSNIPAEAVEQVSVPISSQLDESTGHMVFKDQEPIVVNDKNIGEENEKNILSSKKLRKEEKRRRRIKRIKTDFLATAGTSQQSAITVQGITFEFENQGTENQFNEFRKDLLKQATNKREKAGKTNPHQSQLDASFAYNKLESLLEEIKTHVWRATGEGKPEVLKYLYPGRRDYIYKGCLSRRYNGEDRLVYKVVGPGRVLILDWEGHYHKK